MCNKMGRHWLLVSVILAGSQLITSSAKSDSPPNVVLFMVDDLGIGDLGCYGNNTMRTPNVDRIAKEGAKMTHHISAASICTPSRAAFLTGRYPIRFGMVPHNFIRVILFLCASSGIPANETTIGNIAKQKGYSTAFLGKWHLGLNCERYGDFCHHPLNLGFDYYFGLPLTNLMDFGDGGLNLLTARFPHADAVLLGGAIGGLLLAFMLRKIGTVGRCGFVFLAIIFCAPATVIYPFTFAFARLNGVVMRNFEVVEQPVKLEGFTDRLVREGESYLEDRQKDNKPFLLILSWIQVHTALHAIDPFRQRSQHGTYGDEVEELDWSVGQILKALDRLHLADNTFVYLTSDHGGHNEEKGPHGAREGGYNGIYRGGKGQGGMEGGIRVPGLVRWPGVIPPDSVIDIPTSTMDIFTTVANIIEADIPKDRPIDGVNIAPLLKGDEKVSPPQRFMVHYCGDQIHAARYVPGDGKDVYKAHYATPNWVPGTEGCGYICGCNGRSVTWHNPPQMFNIARDPSEKSPLDVKDPKNKAILDEINKRLDDHRKGVTQVESQFALAKSLPHLGLQPCCNFPYCTCEEKVPKPNRPKTNPSTRKE